MKDKGMKYYLNRKLYYEKTLQLVKYLFCNLVAIHLSITFLIKEPGITFSLFQYI